MGNLSKREINLLGILVVVLILALYYNFFLRGFMEDYNNVNDQIYSTTAQINDAKLKQSALDKTKTTIDQMQDEIENFGKSHLPGLDRPQILRILNTNVYPLAGNVIVRFPVTYTENMGSRIYGVELSFVTQMNNYEKILTNLNDLEYANRVILSQISIADEEQETYSIRMTVEFLTQSNEMESFKIS